MYVEGRKQTELHMGLNGGLQWMQCGLPCFTAANAVVLFPLSHT